MLNAMVSGIVLCAGLWAADFEVNNEARFRKLFPKGAKVEKLATGMKFVEGPVWVEKEKKLIFSDIPANELKVWTRERGVEVFRAGSNNANGNTLDRKGNLVTAEHGAHRISRTEGTQAGAAETVVAEHAGKALNSPNDVVVKRDGTLWFTDPDYGLSGRKKEQAGNYVYRYDERTRELTPVAKDFDKPNGLCFSADERKLYVADSGAPKHIRVFTLSADGRSLAGGEVFAKIDKGGPDGIRCDRAGNVWSSTGDGVQVFAPDGERIARVLLPEAGANVELGGGMLFVTARTSLYAVPVKVKR
ncbi:MAG: SMP-30/gluconolactonase/LRE family protein [Bryobacter sp.]|nr:SMP-30/gluconolactonase/LRE family protein [Bryobacter sp.]